MSKLYSYAGIGASIILIAFGIGSLYMGIDGRDQVRGDLAREQIVGTDDSSDRRPEGRHRRRGAGVRRHDPQAHARGHRWRDLRADGPVPG